ncbi:unnamed protein product [Taenia asiatica]|uniref:Protein kinase domain-containing protein n=1 Tax=Taenia asiatica TaxID=60517 RepID=A0A0R3W979_TAEAS|nr:unnamed protein product [Taenia asiatica]
MDAPRFSNQTRRFPTYNLSFPCSHDYSFFKDLVCYRFALALTRHPQKAITCHVHWQAVEESRSFRQLFLQPGNTYRLLPSDGETNEDELSFEEGADDSEVLLMREIASYMEPPNVTISSIECDFIVNVTCTAPFEPVELYITSHSSDLERCNGSWADLSSDQLSPVNFSVSNYVDVFLANASIRRIDGEDQFVVCRYLEKYDYRRLPISECSTHTGGRAFVFRICIIVVCYFAILLLATLTFWCWYSRRLRRRKRQAIAALIYRRDATLPTNVQHSYANAAGGGYLIFTEFSQSSRSGESSQQHVQSSVEDGQETREIDQSKLKSCANLHTQRMLPKPRPSLQLRRRGLVSVTCCYPPLPTLYRSIRGKGGLIFDHGIDLSARKYFFVPLGRLRKSLVWFRRLRQVEVLLQYYIRIPKSARLLLLCQKRRAKVVFCICELYRDFNRGHGYCGASFVSVGSVFRKRRLKYLEEVSETGSNLLSHLANHSAAIQSLRHVVYQSGDLDGRWNKVYLSHFETPKRLFQ